MEAGEESAHSAYPEIKNLKEEKAKQRRRSERLSSYEDSGESVEVRTGDFRSVLDQESAESIDHIITDPPYDEDALELWAPLGEHAARVLKPGGFLVAYSGKAHLPAVHDALSSHLNYHWQAVVRHAGAGAKIFSRKLRTNYKPVLIYTKGDADLQDDFISDVIEGGGREKDDHDWQQAESEAAKLIESFTEVNDRICDPMCGSGTIAVAADRLDRRCLLIDEDSSAIDTVRERVME
jgi:DNA modification methylase